MLACLDVAYTGDTARAACVVFDRWESAEPSRELVVDVTGVAPYEPGSFYKRELPCLLAALRALATPPECVLVDGYVWLGEGRPGLGAHLFEALGGAVPVVGIAKTAFAGAHAIEVLRGESRRPLFVTAAGMDAERAAELVRGMAGAHRIPTMLQRADRLCRGR